MRWGVGGAAWVWFRELTSVVLPGCSADSMEWRWVRLGMIGGGRGCPFEDGEGGYRGFLWGNSAGSTLGRGPMGFKMLAEGSI